MHVMAYDQSPGKHSTYDLAQKVAMQGVTLLPPYITSSYYTWFTILWTTYTYWGVEIIVQQFGSSTQQHQYSATSGPNKMRYMGQN